MTEQPRCERLIRQYRGSVPCKAPATAESGQIRCRSCRLLEDQRAFGTTFGPEIEELRRACHAAPDVMAMVRFYAGETLSDAREWRGARLEVFAFPLSEGSGIPLGYPGEWADVHLPNIDGPCIIARVRLRHPGQLGILSVTWNGQAVEAIPQPGPEGKPADAARLMRLWRRGGGAGRPEGYRKGQKRSAMDVWRWWQEWLEMDDEDPTLKDLATYFGVRSSTTARKRLEAIGQCWPPINPREQASGN